MGMADLYSNLVTLGMTIAIVDPIDGSMVPYPEPVFQ